MGIPYFLRLSYLGMLPSLGNFTRGCRPPYREFYSGMPRNGEAKYSMTPVPIMCFILYQGLQILIPCLNINDIILPHFLM